MFPSNRTKIARAYSPAENIAPDTHYVADRLGIHESDSECMSLCLHGERTKVHVTRTSKS